MVLQFAHLGKLLLEIHQLKSGHCQVHVALIHCQTWGLTSVLFEGHSCWFVFAKKSIYYFVNDVNHMLSFLPNWIQFYLKQFDLGFDLNRDAVMVHLFHLGKRLSGWTLCNCLLLHHLLNDLVQLVSQITTFFLLLICCNTKSLLKKLRQ